MTDVTWLSISAKDHSVTVLLNASLLFLLLT